MCSRIIVDLVGIGWIWTKYFHLKFETMWIMVSNHYALQHMIYCTCMYLYVVWSLLQNVGAIH